MRIGVVFNWPGSENSELDLIGRIVYLLNKWGHEALVLDLFGKLLDPESGDYTHESNAAGHQVDFLLYLHYINPKLIDSFSYVVNWNPLRYLVFEPSTGEPMPPQYVQFVRQSMISHDHMLSASSSQVDDFQYALFGDTRWAPAKNELKLHTSCQIFEGISQIDLTDFKVFYIGVNWEKLKKIQSPDIKARHEGMLEALDATGDFVFYGVRRLFGVDLWADFQHYQGQLPFDAGESIVNTCNQHGVALVLSSDPHRESNLVSTRIFQACAARCVIIADNNSFIIDNFGESVLVFDYEQDPGKTVQNILEKVQWIKNNPSEAQRKAEEAHSIFKERFSLDAELGRILSHSERNAKSATSQFTEANGETIDVYFIFSGAQVEQLTAFFEQLAHIQSVSARGVIITPTHLAQLAADTCEKIRKKLSGVDCEIVGIDDFDKKPDGAIFYEAFSSCSSGTFFALWNPSIFWHRDHLANLVTESLTTGNRVTQSSTYVRNEWYDLPAPDPLASSFSTNATNPLDLVDLITLNRPRIEFSSFVFKSSLISEDSSNMELLKYLGDLYAFLLIISNYNKNNELPRFVPKLTCRHTMTPGRIDVSSGRPSAEDFFLTYDERNPIYSPEQQATFIQGIQYNYKRSVFRQSVVHDADGSAISLHSGNSNANYAFSIDRYMRTVLSQRSVLLKLWVGTYRMLRRTLKLNH